MDDYYEATEPQDQPPATRPQERAVLQLPPSMIPFPVPSPVLGLNPPGPEFWNAVLEAQRAARQLEKIHEGPPNKKAGKTYERVNRSTGEMLLDYPPMFTYVSAEQYIEELRRVCHPQGLVVIQVGCLGEQNLHGTRDRMASGFVIVHAKTASGGLVPFEFPMSHKKIDAAAENAYTKAWSYFVRGFLQIPRADPRDEGVFDAHEQYAQGWDGRHALPPPVEQLGVVPVRNHQVQQPNYTDRQPQASQPLYEQAPQQGQDQQWRGQQDQQPWQGQNQQGQDQQWHGQQDQQPWHGQDQQPWQGQAHDQQQAWQQPHDQGAWQQPQPDMAAPDQQQAPVEGQQQQQQPLPNVYDEPMVKETKDHLQAELVEGQEARSIGRLPTNGNGGAHYTAPPPAGEPTTPDEWRAALLQRGWDQETASQLVTTNLNEPIPPGLREELASLAVRYYQNSNTIREAWQDTGFEPQPSLPAAIRPRPTGLQVLRFALKMNYNQQHTAAQ